MSNYELRGCVNHRRWWLVCDYPGTNRRARVDALEASEQSAREYARACMRGGAIRVRVFGADPASGEAAPWHTLIDCERGGLLL